MQQFAHPSRLGDPHSLPNTHDREREHLQTLGRRLYILAWVIEGIAVALGLGMALSLNMPGQSSFADFFLGGGGFVMVACAELSKIPLATFFVQTPSRRAKLGTLAFLLLMSFITFETIFFSLERGFNARLLIVRSLSEEIAGLNAEHKQLSSLIENPGAALAASRGVIEKQLSEIDSSYKLETGSITSRREIIHKEQKSSDLPREIEAQIQTLEARRPALLQERASRIAAVNEHAVREERSLNGQMNAARKANDVGRYTRLRRAGAIVRARADKARLDAEANYRQQGATLERSISELASKRVYIVADREDAAKPQLAELAQHEKQLYQDYLRKRATKEKELADLRASETATIAQAARAQLRRDALAATISKKETEYRRLAAESQLHRIAAPLAGWWTGEDYEPDTIPKLACAPRRECLVWIDGSAGRLGRRGGCHDLAASHEAGCRSRQSKQSAAPPQGSITGCPIGAHFSAIPCAAFFSNTG